MSEKSNKSRKDAKRINPADLVARSSSDTELLSLKNNLIASINEKVKNNEDIDLELNQLDILEKNLAIGRRQKYSNRIFWFMVFCTILVFSIITFSAMSFKFNAPDLICSVDIFLFFVPIIFMAILSPLLFLYALDKLFKRDNESDNKNKNKEQYNEYIFEKNAQILFTNYPILSIGSIYLFFLGLFLLVIFGYVEIKFTLEPMVQSTLVGSFFLSLFTMMGLIIKGIFDHDKNDNLKDRKI